MRSNKNSSTYISFTALYVLFVGLLYSPFVFFAFISETLRLSLFGGLILLVLGNLFLLKINKNKILKHFLLFGLLCLYIISSIVINREDEAIRSAMGYSLILSFALLLFIALENNYVLVKIIFKYYVIFFKIVTISMLINFALNTISTSVNFLTPFITNKFNYDYNASLFGLSINKNILGINITRNFFFFVEPVYTAPFFLFNILISNKSVYFKDRYFFYLNIIAGILSFSFLFFIGLLVIYINGFRKIIRNGMFFVLLLVVIYVYFNIDDDNLLFASSSSTDRFDRIKLAFDVLPEFSIINILFGGGYSLTQNLAKGISSGMFSSLLEGGVTGLFIPLVFIFTFLNNNKFVIVISILSLFTMEIYKMPLFWVAIILCGLINLNENQEYRNRRS